MDYRARRKEYFGGRTKSNARISYFRPVERDSEKSSLNCGGVYFAVWDGDAKAYKRAAP